MRVLIGVLGILVVAVYLRTQARFSAHSLSVIFFDVGQGDAALVRFPGGRVWMIDAGGGFQDWDVGKKDLFLELTRLGILEIDVALLSHPDEDHAMGFRSLFQQLTVREWWYHDSIFKPGRIKPVTRELELSARARKVRTVAVTRPIDGNDHGAWWRVVPLQTAAANANDRALIAEISYGGCDFVFTGDIESEGESALLETVSGQKEFLKVAHHGSRTSSRSDVLSALQPTLAVISAGRHNLYGHPFPAVVDRFTRLGTRVLRTDYHGFVRIDVSDEGTFRCRSFVGDCGTGRCARPPTAPSLSTGITRK